MTCRHCGVRLENGFVDLGFSPPSNAYLDAEDLNRAETYYPLRVAVCNQCWLVQTEDYAQAEELFNEMILFAKPVTAEIAADVGIVDQVVSDPADLLSTALDLVERLQENLPRIREAAVELPDITIPESPQAGKQPLSREAVMITADAVRKAAAAEGLDQALELGYAGFGEIACSDAAKEGISAFLQRRKPNFKK